MARKSTDTDIKLLKEGRRLLIKKGASKLSIREVSTAAGVNLGMFSYHFGSKDKFIEIILSNIYDELLVNFELVEGEASLEILEQQLMLLAQFARDNRHLIFVLLNDILNGEKAVQKFARSKMRKHFVMLGKTIRGCQREKLITDAPLALVLTHIAAGLGLSNLIPEVLKNLGINKVFDLGLSVVSKSLVTDKALEMRVEMVMKGLRV